MGGKNYKINQFDMTPKEYADKLHLKLFHTLPNNGGYDGISSIPKRWEEGLECSIITVDAIMDFMQMDDELHDDCHFANSKWVPYFTSVKNELHKKLKELNNNNSMDTLKVKVYNPTTMTESKEIDTGIDKEIIELVRLSLNNSENYLITPNMLEPDTFDVSIGILKKTENGDLKKEYKITIEKIN